MPVTSEAGSTGKDIITDITHNNNLLSHVERYYKNFSDEQVEIVKAYMAISAVKAKAEFMNALKAGMQDRINLSEVLLREVVAGFFHDGRNNMT